MKTQEGEQRRGNLRVGRESFRPQGLNPLGCHPERRSAAFRKVERFWVNRSACLILASKSAPFPALTLYQGIS